MTCIETRGKPLFVKLVFTVSRTHIGSGFLVCLVITECLWEKVEGFEGEG